MNYNRQKKLSAYSPLQGGYYRVAVYDLDGSLRYTSILRSSCNATDALKLWPNPAFNKVASSLVNSGPSQAVIMLFDSKGALVKMQIATIAQGMNELTVDITSLSKGAYRLSVTWNNGLNQKEMEVVKQ
ncbi:MAG: T9SS type A sorting domain-containing protein [Ferruginibacter sp.]